MRSFLTASVLFILSQSALGLEIMHPNGPYTQAATGMTYPDAVDQFRRVNIIRYQPDGSDESAGYNDATPLREINMTVYVFPSPPVLSIGSPRSAVEDTRRQLCQSQYEKVQQEVMTAHPDAVLVEKKDVSLSQAGIAHAGHFASFDLTNAKFFGRSDVPSRSEAFLYCYVGGKWSVEYRIDYPRDFDAADPIARFMNDLVWTIPPEQN
jgi:hypothetical protein